MDKLPSHKVIPGTSFTVDGFRCVSSAVTAYFLSHAHSDHYQGITENWDAGLIYCSETTARLIIHMLGVNPTLVRRLPMDSPVIIQGVEVTLVTANHCPGAVQFIFRLASGEAYLHCGDMRYAAFLQDDKHLQQVVGCRAVFLDTTYCNPKYTFPLQEAAVEYVASTIEGLMKKPGERAYIISTYVIGKEKILLEVHRRCGVKLHLSERKMGIMRCLQLAGVNVDEVFTTDPAETSVHVAGWGFLGDTWPFFRPNFVNMEAHREERRAEEVVGFVPTGWMYEMKRSDFPVRKKGSCQVHLVPYSEHSSYEELREYVKFLKPQEIIPTVNAGSGDAEGQKRVASMLKHFRGLVDETAAKSRFLSAFHRKASGGKGAKKQEGSDCAAPHDAKVDPGDAAGDSTADKAEEGGISELDPPEGLTGPDAEEAGPSAAKDDSGVPSNVPKAGAAADVADSKPQDLEGGSPVLQAASGRATTQRHSRRKPTRGRPGATASAPGASLAAKINAQSAAKLGTGGLQPASQPMKAEGAAVEQADQAAGLGAGAADMGAVDQVAQPQPRAASVAAIEEVADQDGTAVSQPPSAQPEAPATHAAAAAADGSGRGQTDADLDAALAASAMDADGWQIMPDAPGGGDGGCGGIGDEAAGDNGVGAAAAGAQPSNAGAASGAVPAAAATPGALAGEHSLSSADTQPLSEAIRFLEDIGAVSSPPHSGRKRGRRPGTGGAAADTMGNSGGSGAEAVATGVAAAPASAPASAGAGGSEGAGPAPMEVDLPAARHHPPDCVDLATEPRPAVDSSRPGGSEPAASSGSRDSSRQRAQPPAPGGLAAAAAEDGRRPEPSAASSVATAAGQAFVAPAAMQQHGAAGCNGATAETARGSSASGFSKQTHRRGGGTAAGEPNAAARSTPAPAKGGQGSGPGPVTQVNGNGDEAAGPSNPALSELLGVMGDGVSREDAERLLVCCGGNVSAALNMFFDGGAAAAGGTQAAQQASQSPSRVASMARNNSAAASTRATPSKRKAAGGASASSKQGGGGSGGGKRGGSRKEKAPPDRSQPSIMSFFGTSPPASPAAHRLSAAASAAAAAGSEDGVAAVSPGSAAARPRGDGSPGRLALRLPPAPSGSPMAASTPGAVERDARQPAAAPPEATAADADRADAFAMLPPPKRRAMGPSHTGGDANAPESPTRATAGASELPPPRTPERTASARLRQQQDIRDRSSDAAAAAATAAAPADAVTVPGDAGDGKSGGNSAATAVVGEVVAASAVAAESAGQPKAKLPAPDAVTKSMREYRPVEDACWAAGEQAPYMHLAQAFAAMDGTTKRLKIADVITNMFRSVLALSPGCMLEAAYLTLGKIAPDWQQLELHVGGATVANAVSEATGVTRGQLRRMHDVLGDMGDVAQECRVKQTMLMKPKPLTLAGVYATLRTIALTKGAGSAQRKQDLIKQLVSRCRGVETKYLVRTLVQNLRVGANWRSVVGPLARAVLLHREGLPKTKAELDGAAKAALEAFHLCPNLEILVPALVEGGPGELQRRCSLTPGVPLKPMLAKICEGIPDAIAQLRDHGGRFLAEFKYDGVRAQIHLLDDGTVKVFSRNCEDRSGHFPDVGDALRAAAAGGASSLVLDAEIVAVDRSKTSGAGSSPQEAVVGATGGADGGGGGTKLRAFQELSTRARGNITSDQVTVTVGVFVFDVLYADGEVLVNLPLCERRARMQHLLPNLRPGFVELAHSIEVVASSNSGSSGLTPASSASLAICSSSAVSVSPAGPVTDEGQPASASENAAAASGSEAGGSDVEDAGSGDDAGAAAATSPATPASAAAAEALAAKQGRKQDGKQGISGKAAAAADAGATAGADAAADAGPAPVELAAAEGDEQTPVAVAKVQEFLLKSFAEGTEGLMLKRLDAGSAYQPSKRSESWIKIKRDYCEGLRDSLDLVPIGGWYGNGRKAGWISPFLLAAWDPETETLATVCRCMSGFTDAFYTEASARMRERQLPGPKPYYVTSEQPDMWFDAAEVWEIRGADLTISPVHKAAAGRLHPERGVSLRFPRFIRERTDKGVEDATGPDVIVDLYNRQTRRMQTAQERLGAGGN